ncbi:thiamine pyrophosphate-binding protein [Photobacterium atrarenae]|uniref:Thiamine pyrophosphate-binding protein n=1 Tax=Photobacterium atrarenae TaxID=865757 RepID=A0ABY5GHG8_9GAMM|nr:thiamine pyrophosphate-binding protein [Photobacterium atrarenae]UTV28575.1 thiamine pyrophosphate-binding protein [Photobacterium atrarenae]
MTTSAHQSNPSTTRYILDTLLRHNVRHLFMVPGGVVDPFLDEFGEGEHEMKAIVAANEAGAAYMADGYARASGKFGVCMGIGGPGIANMVGPLAAAYSDESPLLVLAGEIPTEWMGRGGFQDASAAGINDAGFLAPVTASAQTIPEARMVPHMLDMALRTMLGRIQRPVSLSLPKQIQSQPVTAEPQYQHHNKLHPDEQRQPVSLQCPRTLDISATEKLLRTLNQACRQGNPHISILAGSGALRSGATDALVRFAERYQIPVATTLKAKGVFPENHPLSLGVFGYAGTQHATLALLNDEPGAATLLNQDVADNHLLLVLGSSLNQRDTMRWDGHLTPACGIVQVDIEPAAFSRNYPVDTAINGDVATVLDWLLADEQQVNLTALQETQKTRQVWLDSITCHPRFYNEADRFSNASPMHPARVIHELQQIAPPETVVIGDSGAHRAFLGHYWQSQGPRQYLTATALAPMGWAIPAGVGAKVANPDSPCVIVTGDGCMLMNGIEIQSAARHQLPLIVVVINNSALGNVYLRAKTPIAKSLTTLSTHNWADFARAMGGDGVVVEEPADLAPALDRAFTAKGPFVIDARCDPSCPTPINPWRREIEHPNWAED